MADNDQFRILVGGTATNTGFAEIATADDGTEPIHVRQYTGVFSTLVRTATLLDGSGNTSFPGSVSMTGALNVNTSGTGTLNLGDAQISKAPGSGFSFSSGIGSLTSLGIGTAANNASPLSVFFDTATKFNILRGAANQLADLIEFQTSSGTVLGGRNANAQIFSGSTDSLTTSTGGATTATSGTGTVATITTTSAHSLATGDRVTVAGVTPTGYNGTFIVTGTPTTTTFTYSNATTGSQTVAGTVRVDAQASITSRSAATVGLLVRAAASQSSNPFEVQNSSGTVIANVTSGGGVRATGTLQGATLSAVTDGSTIATLSANGNVQFRGSASYGSGSGVIGIANAATAPSTSPTGGGILFVNAGALQYRGTSGGNTTIVNADGTVAFTSPSITTSLTTPSTSFDLINTTATTVNAFGAATTLNLGTASGNVTIGNSGTLSTGTQTVNLFTGGSTTGTTQTINLGTGNFGLATQTINIGTGTISSATRTINIGSTSGTGTTTLNGIVNHPGTTSPIHLNGSAGTSGQVLTSAGAGATPTWTTVSGGTFTGGTLTSALTLRLGGVGTAGTGPIYFDSTSGATNILTTPVSGALEYDGTVFYSTSNTGPGRALATQDYYYASSSNYSVDFSGSGAVQSMLGATTRGITVAAGTTYEYELQMALQHQYFVNTGITGTFQIVGTTVSGSPTVAHTSFVDYGSNTTSFTTATTMSSVRTTGNVTFSAAISSGSRYSIVKVKGLIRVTGTGTVKIYPGISASGTNDNSWTIQSGLSFRMTPIGNGTVTTVGAWA
jgi:hypothetical protein